MAHIAKFFIAFMALTPFSIMHLNIPNDPTLQTFFEFFANVF